MPEAIQSTNQPDSSSDSFNEANHNAMPIIDIVIVLLITGSVFLFENYAISQGWMPYAEEVRGALSMVCGAIAAVCVTLYRGRSMADLGFKRPKRWVFVPGQVLLILLAFVAAQTLVPSLVSIFIELPAPDLSRYDAITGNMAAAILMALVLPLTASIPEEVIYRGFLIGRLETIFGNTNAWMAVLVQGLVFGAIHFQWGIGGIIVTFIMGIVWGTAYILCDRNLWVVILAHSAGHLLLVTQLYLGESIVI